MRWKLLLCSLVAALAGCATEKLAPVVDRSSGEAAEKAAPTDAGKAAVPERVARKGYHLVKEGDTLYRIALDHGQAYRDLATWNQLADPNKIVVGQELRVVPPEAEEAPTVVVKPIAAVATVEQRPLEGATETLKTRPKAGREPYSDEALARLNKSAESALPKLEIRTEKTEIKPEIKPEARIEVKNEGRVEGKTGKGDDDLVWAWPANGKIAAQFAENGGSKGVDIAGKKGDPVQAAADGKVVYSGTGLRGYGQLLIVKHNATYLTAYAHNSKVLVKEGQAVTRGQKVAEMGDTEADQVKLHFEVRRLGKPVDPQKYLPAR